MRYILIVLMLLLSGCSSMSLEQQFRANNALDFAGYHMDAMRTINAGGMTRGYK